MFLNLGILEILIIVILAFLIIGSKNLPKVGKKAGEIIKSFDKNTEGIKREIDEIKQAINIDSSKETKK